MGPPGSHSSDSASSTWTAARRHRRSCMAALRVGTIPAAGACGLHHPQTRCSVCSRCKDEPFPFTPTQSEPDDHANRAGDYKFNPLVLAEFKPALTLDASAPAAASSPEMVTADSSGLHRVRCRAHQTPGKTRASVIELNLTTDTQRRHRIEDRAAEATALWW
jgi:hypothetical protein